ncbi:MAG: hypothetical protein ACXAE3_17295, partial [Candidatus Kariarchaeaceae archaeon]
MDLNSIINTASRLYNKILMLALGIVIFSLFLIAAGDPASFNLESTLGRSLLIAWGLFTLISLFYTVNGILLNTNFNKSVKRQRQKGKPVEGIRGFEDFKKSLKGARNFSLLVTISSMISLAIFISSIAFDPTFASDPESFRAFLATLAITFAFITISVLFLVDYPEETSFSPGGLIGFFEPDAGGMTLDNLLSDVFITYLDPATYLDIDEWAADISSRLKDNLEADETPKTRLERARERILLLLYLNYSNPDILSDEVLRRELIELVGDSNVDPLIRGDETGLSFAEVTKILKRIESMSPEPFRLVDRLMIKL